jgi:hypothetical protein
MDNANSLDAATPQLFSGRYHSFSDSLEYRKKFYLFTENEQVTMHTTGESGDTH